MKIKVNHRFICFVIATVTLMLTLLFTSCSSVSAETKTETADHPCYHVTVYSPKIDHAGNGSERHPKYTITVNDFEELLPDQLSAERDYQLLRIPLEDGRFELVSTSLVEIEYY
jgi:hypothetical protein|nr:MAG TPA: protein of unknown function (DUF4972) [Caudoviricetes sp.]